MILIIGESEHYGIRYRTVKINLPINNKNSSEAGVGYLTTIWWIRSLCGLSRTEEFSLPNSLSNTVRQGSFRRSYKMLCPLTASKTDNGF